MRLFPACVRIPSAGMAYALVLAEMESDEGVRLRSGDRAAMAQVVERYHHRLYRYLIRFVREPAAADDLYQETWLNVVRKIGSFDGRSKFDTWLFAIAHNQAVDFLRKKTGEVLDDRAADAPDALTLAVEAERSARLESAV